MQPTHQSGLNFIEEKYSRLKLYNNRYFSIILNSVKIIKTIVSIH